MNNDKRFTAEKNNSKIILNDIPKDILDTLEIRMKINFEIQFL